MDSDPFRTDYRSERLMHKRVYMGGKSQTVMGDYYKLHLLLRWCRNAL